MNSSVRLRPQIRELLCLVTFLVTTGDSGAVMIASDGFDYPLGAIAGRNGGSGFSAPYTGNGQINDDSLHYTDSGGRPLPEVGRHVSTNTNGNGMFRTLSTVGRPAGMLDGTGKFGADGSTVYVGFLERLDSGVVNNFGDYCGLSFFNGVTEELFFGDLGWAGTHTFWGVDPQRGEGAVRESTVPVNSTVRLLIGRIDFALGLETVRFYVDPPLNAEPATATLGPFTMHDFRFDQIRIQGGGAGRYSFDGVALGTTYSDVTPEPSVLALLGAASLLVFRRQRGVW